MLREESARLRSQSERLRTDRTALQQRLGDTETSLHEAQEQLRFDFKKKLSEKESQTELYYFSHLIFDSICHIAFILSSISFLSIFVGYI